MRGDRLAEHGLADLDRQDGRVEGDDLAEPVHQRLLAHRVDRLLLLRTLTVPAIVLNKYGDVVDANALARELSPDMTPQPGIRTADAMALAARVTA